MCTIGPSDQQMTPIIALVLTTIASTLTLLLTFLVYENQESWKDLGYVTSAFSLLTLLLMLVVMCSDPGIQTRDKLLQISSSAELDENNAISKQNGSYDGELPDLVELGFNTYEQTAIRKGFSNFTGSID